ncbi:hypothetical protein F5878DRAFT_645548 [Lentinula raphanica]|uniref:Uncharacterized protein n=1 Tax=Lentinula raphanica TaxID=153919 RepID=A0AA38P0A6_9AGAR|nr:hypothetical protein F5878DRAFT_645548 [Lentinula raphanica]
MSQHSRAAKQCKAVPYTPFSSPTSKRFYSALNTSHLVSTIFYFDTSIGYLVILCLTFMITLTVLAAPLPNIHISNDPLSPLSTQPESKPGLFTKLRQKFTSSMPFGRGITCYLVREDKGTKRERLYFAVGTTVIGLRYARGDPPGSIHNPRAVGRPYMISISDWLDGDRWQSFPIGIADIKLGQLNDVVDKLLAVEPGPLGGPEGNDLAYIESKLMTHKDLHFYSTKSQQNLFERLKSIYYQSEAYMRWVGLAYPIVPARTNAIPPTSPPNPAADSPPDSSSSGTSAALILRPS